MKTLIAVFRELAGLFVDDGALALVIIAVVGVAGIVAALAPDRPIVAGIVLLLGCLGGLLANVTQWKP